MSLPPYVYVDRRLPDAEKAIEQTHLEAAAAETSSSIADCITQRN